MLLPIEIIEIILSYVGDEKLYFEILNSTVIPRHLRINFENEKYRCLLNKTKNILFCDLLREIDRSNNVVSYGYNEKFIIDLFVSFLQKRLYIEAFLIFHLSFSLYSEQQRKNFIENTSECYKELRSFVLHTLQITIYKSRPSNHIIFYSLNDIARFFLYCELFSFNSNGNFYEFLNDFQNKIINYVQQYEQTCVVFKTNIDGTYLKFNHLERTYKFQCFNELFKKLKQIVVECLCDCDNCFEFKCIESRGMYNLFFHNFIIYMLQ